MMNRIWAVTWTPDFKLWFMAFTIRPRTVMSRFWTLITLESIRRNCRWLVNSVLQRCFGLEFTQWWFVTDPRRQGSFSSFLESGCKTVISLCLLVSIVMHLHWAQFVLITLSVFIFLFHPDPELSQFTIGTVARHLSGLWAPKRCKIYWIWSQRANRTISWSFVLSKLIN